MPQRPQIRLFFDGGGCLWAADPLALDQFGVGPLDAAVYDLNGTVIAAPRLTLGDWLRSMIAEAVALHETALNMDDPAGPSPWGEAERDRFRRLVDALLLALQAELGADIEVIDAQPR